jgi:hypothetical protein
VARLCLALLRNMKYSHIVADKSVRNFDMVSYHRGNPRGFPLFLMVAGGLMSLVICTFKLRYLFDW